MTELGTKDLDELVQIVLRQTDYTEDTAKKLLNENNLDPMIVIKKYMGTYKETKDKIVTSREMNQEIYKQFRQKLHITKDLQPVYQNPDDK